MKPTDLPELLELQALARRAGASMTRRVLGEGVQLLATLGVGPDTKPMPAGVVVAPTPVTNLGDATAAMQIAHDFIAAIAKHRHWDRANVDSVPA